MKKIFLFDIDGTLLPVGNHQIPYSTKYAINELQKQGHTIVVATGKSIKDAIEVADELNIDYMLTTNGQVFSNKKEIIKEQDIDPQIITKIIKDNKDICTFGLQNSFEVYFLEGDHLGLAKEILEKLQIFDFQIKKTYDSSISVNQMLACGKTEGLKLPEEYKALNWVINGGVDIIPKSASKAEGMKMMFEVLKKDEYEKIYCFGDGPNDLEMFKNVDISVAMGNGCDELKNIATSITDDCDKDGIYNFLVKENLIEEKK